MPKVKITVLKRMVNQDLVDEFCEADVTVPCPHFAEGQVFTVDGIAQPENFCGAAWHDIHKSYLAIRQGGSFDGWMKDDDTLIACCSDGLRPVVFELKRLSD
jgi:uncharacterized repeat protein (TIGR04076 family)